MVSCAPARRDGDRVVIWVQVLGALISWRRFPGTCICSHGCYSVVGAVHLIDTGEGQLLNNVVRAALAVRPATRPVLFGFGFCDCRVALSGATIRRRGGKVNTQKRIESAYF